MEIRVTATFKIANSNDMYRFNDIILVDHIKFYTI